MSLMVCGGGMCTCSFGTAPSSLTITPECKCIIGSPAATTADAAGGKNIMPFGMCTSMANPAVASATAAALGVLTPQPCMPATAGMWIPGNAKVLIGGKPALTSDSSIGCIYGGIIKIASPGQTGASTG